LENTQLFYDLLDPRRDRFIDNIPIVGEGEGVFSRIVLSLFRIEVI
jgi:hypothetical protein